MTGTRNRPYRLTLLLAELNEVLSLESCNGPPWLVTVGISRFTVHTAVHMEIT